MHLNAQKTDTKKIQKEEGEKNHNNKKDQENHLPPVT